MNKSFSFALGLAFAFTLSASGGARAHAADKTPPAPTAAKAKGEEVTVTLKGDLGCGKCNFKTTKACQNVLKVTEGGKEVLYYLAANPVSEQNHEAVCTGIKPATVTGTVTEEGAGKGAKKKKVLVASAIKLD